MKYRYLLPERLLRQATLLEEFANGGAQCHARLLNGTVHAGLLVSNGTAIIAMRGRRELPFSVEDIASLFQEGDDQNPLVRGEWEYWDAWP